MKMSQQPSELERVRQSLRIMQAALEKAKTTHGDLFTFGDCASVYTAMMTLNTFIDKQEQAQPSQSQSTPASQNQQTQQTVQKTQVQPFLTLNQPPTVTYQTN